MKLEFASGLERICTDEAHKLGLPIAIVKAARRKLILLEQAPDERTLRNWKALNYKQKQGDKEGRRSIRVNDQYRIEFLLFDQERPQRIRIVEIGDTH